MCTGFGCALFHFVSCIVLAGFMYFYLPISFNVDSLPLEQAYVCPNVSGISWKNMGTIIKILTNHNWARNACHDDVIKWKHFARYWPFARGIHRSPVNSPHKGQWRGALMLSLIYAWIHDWVNNREGGDLISHRAHYDVTVMLILGYALSCTILFNTLFLKIKMEIIFHGTGGTTQLHITYFLWTGYTWYRMFSLQSLMMSQFYANS